MASSRIVQGPIVDWSDFITCAQTALREVIQVARQGMGRLEKGVYTKGDGSPVTDIDKAIETRLVDRFRTVFPGVTILGEETGVDMAAQSAEQLYRDYFESEYQITIDPIDGTRNYINGQPQYCIAVALSQRRDSGVWPIVGAIAVPEAKEIYWNDDKGVFIEHVEHQQVRPVVLDHISTSRISVNSRDRTWLAEQDWQLQVPWVSSGSSVYDFLDTILGRNRASFVGAQRLWDLMAPLALAMRAGLILRDVASGVQVCPITRQDLSCDLVARPWGLSRKMILARPAVRAEELLSKKR